MKGYGVVLKKLRQLNKLSLKQGAQLMGRSSGWLSQVENERGYTRLKPEVFEQAIQVYKGECYRKQFSGWMTTTKLHQHKNTELSFDGSILKYLRIKAGLTLLQVSNKAKLSSAYISSLESGKRPLNKELRDQLIVLYGYSPASFRNFTDETKRAGNIPIQFKIQVLLKTLTQHQLGEVFQFLESQLNKKG